MLDQLKSSEVAQKYIELVTIPNYLNNLNTIMVKVAEEQGGKLNKVELGSLVADMSEGVYQSLDLTFDSLDEVEFYVQTIMDNLERTKLFMDLQERYNANYLTDERLFKVISLNRG